MYLYSILYLVSFGWKCLGLLYRFHKPLSANKLYQKKKNQLTINHTCSLSSFSRQSFPKIVQKDKNF